MADSRAGLSDEQTMMMPSSSAAQRNIHRQRVIPGAANVDAETLETIIFEGDFQLDKEGITFFRNITNQIKETNFYYMIPVMMMQIYLFFLYSLMSME